jgi:hypothetical protein
MQYEPGESQGGRVTVGQSGAIGGVDEYLAYIGLGGVLELDLTSMYDFTLHWIRGCSA